MRAETSIWSVPGPSTAASERKAFVPNGPSPRHRGSFVIACSKRRQDRGHRHRLSARANGSANEADGVREVLVEVRVVPGDVRVLHRGRKIEAWNCATLAPDNAGERRSYLVFARGSRMACRTMGRKYRLAGRGIAGGECRRRRYFQHKGETGSWSPPRVVLRSEPSRSA